MKKQLIMNQALELFAERGIGATSIQQITDRCGISKGAFYLSFKSKEELIVELVDHFMIQIASDIDYMVKNEEKDQLLYKFYYHSCNFFHKNSDFAKLFMKEEAQTVNDGVIEKVHYYNQLMEQSLLELVERVYGKQEDVVKYDLILCMKAFAGIYAELCLTLDILPDVELFSKALVEKTDLIANNGRISLITKEMVSLFTKKKNFKKWTEEELIELMNQIIIEFEDSIEKDSLLLLCADLKKKEYPLAIVNGLIHNIQENEYCKWVAFLLRKHYEI